MEITEGWINVMKETPCSAVTMKRVTPVQSLLYHKISEQHLPPQIPCDHFLLSQNSQR